MCRGGFHVTPGTESNLSLKLGMVLFTQSHNLAFVSMPAPHEETSHREARTVPLHGWLGTGEPPEHPAPTGLSTKNVTVLLE